MPQPKATVSVTIRLSREACEALDLFAGTTYPGTSRETVIKLILADHLSPRAGDPAGTVQRQSAWNKAIREAYNVAAEALRTASVSFAVRAATINDHTPPSGGVVFDDQRAA